MSSATAPAGFPQPGSGHGPTPGSEMGDDTRAMPSSLGPARDVILRDGGTLRLGRPARRRRRARRVLLAALGSRYLRFHGAARGAQLVEPFVDPDWVERGALVGSSATTEHRRGRQLRAAPRPEHGRGAFAVADDYQARASAPACSSSSPARRGARASSAFIAEVLPENRRCSPSSRTSASTTRTLDGGVVEVRFPIEPTERLPDARRRARPRRGRRVAATVLRAEDGRGRRRLGAPRLDRRRAVPEHPRGRLHGRGVPGEPLRRRRSPACGRTRSIEEIADADRSRRRSASRRAHVLDGGRGGASQPGHARSASSPPASRRRGPRGAQRQERAARPRPRARRTPGRAELPRHRAPRASGSTPRSRRAHSRPGRIGFSSQRGALGLALLERADARGLGFSAFVSIGNKADVSSNDLLEWWEDDPATDVVLLYLESFGNPRKFARARAACRAPEADPRDEERTHARGRAAAGSHTAALAGSDAAVDASSARPA